MPSWKVAAYFCRKAWQSEPRDTRKMQKMEDSQASTGMFPKFNKSFRFRGLKISRFEFFRFRIHRYTIR